MNNLPSPKNPIFAKIKFTKLVFVPLIRNEYVSSLDNNKIVLNTKSTSFGKPLVNEFSNRSKFDTDELLKFISLK
jgi:hypothetical protein